LEAYLGAEALVHTGSERQSDLAQAEQIAVKLRASQTKTSARILIPRNMLQEQDLLRLLSSHRPWMRSGHSVTEGVPMVSASESGDGMIRLAAQALARLQRLGILDRLTKISSQSVSTIDRTMLSSHMLAEVAREVRKLDPMHQYDLDDSSLAVGQSEAGQYDHPSLALTGLLIRSSAPTLAFSHGLVAASTWCESIGANAMRFRTMVVAHAEAKRLWRDLVHQYSSRLPGSSFAARFEAEKPVHRNEATCLQWLMRTDSGRIYLRGLSALDLIRQASFSATSHSILLARAESGPGVPSDVLPPSISLFHRTLATPPID